MAYKINEDACKKELLSPEEALILLSYYDTCSGLLTRKKLEERGLIELCRTVSGDTFYDLTKEGKAILLRILNNSNISRSQIDYINLAKKLREIFPVGTKDGTSYQWRGSTAEITSKLKTLSLKYDNSFTEEEAINATKAYVESFNGNYRYMRLLKYFILKNERDADDNLETKSQLMELIENNNDTSSIKQDWTSSIV